VNGQGWDKDNNPFVQGQFQLDMNFTDWDLCFQEYQTESVVKSSAPNEILENDPSKTTYNKFVKEATKGQFGAADADGLKTWTHTGAYDCNKYRNRVIIQSDLVIRPKSFLDCFETGTPSVQVGEIKCKDIRNVARDQTKLVQAISLTWIPSICRLTMRKRVLTRKEAECEMKYQRMDKLNFQYYLEMMEGNLNQPELNQMWDSLKAQLGFKGSATSDLVTQSINSHLAEKAMKLSHCIEKQVKVSSYDLWCELGDDQPLRYADLDAKQKNEFIKHAQKLMKTALGGDYEVIDDDGTPRAHLKGMLVDGKTTTADMADQNTIRSKEDIAANP